MNLPFPYYLPQNHYSVHSSAQPQPYPYQPYRNSGLYGPSEAALYANNPLVQHTLGRILDARQNGASLENIDAILGDKKTLLWSRIELILLHLQERKYVSDRVTYEIDQDLCRTNTILLEMNSRQYGINRERLQVEKIKFDLLKQKRMEETSYFKDTGMLNCDLIDTLIRYLDQVQKEKIINGMEEKP